MPDAAREAAIAGCLIGTAVGDALGLPRENLGPRRGHRLFPDLERHHFLIGRGMFSDDTEHACMTAQALLVSGGDSKRFLSSLAWRLRWWLLGFPFSIGRATLYSCCRLWLGVPASRSGVRSAGNGPATRSLILGVCLGGQPDRLKELVRSATRITHRDPKAEWGALAVAQAGWLSAQFRDAIPDVQAFADGVVQVLPPDASELTGLIRRAAASVSANQTTEAFADELGLQRGVSGYMLHTVPVVLHAWMRFPDDYGAAVRTVIRCGGDTDSTAALVGGIVGARVGVEAIPEPWRRGLCEWPRDLRWIERLARALAAAEGRPARGVPLGFLGLIPRNLLFNLTVLCHVVRRLFPPY